MAAATRTDLPTSKGANTRDRIVAAASELMTDYGVGATRLHDIQVAAGVGPSQIYHYFADKADLVRAVLAYREDTVVGTQVTALGAVTSFADLRAWADEVVAAQDRLGCRGGCPIGSLSSELAEVDDDARYRVSAAFELWRDAIRDGLRRLRDSGLLAPDADVERFADTLLAAAQGGLLLGQAQRATRPLRNALHGVIDLLEQAGGTPVD